MFIGKRQIEENDIELFVVEPAQCFFQARYVREPYAAAADLRNLFPEITGIRRIVFDQQNPDTFKIHRFRTLLSNGQQYPLSTRSRFYLNWRGSGGLSRLFNNALRLFLLVAGSITFGCVCLGLTFVAGASAQSGSLSVVSAASYLPAAAPNSLASIFGSSLAGSTASATLSANGQLPTTLAGVTVQVNGENAPLIYVSPGQINLVIPDDTVTGVATVAVKTGFGFTIQGTVLVNVSAPGLFAINGSGSGPGAILNGVTYAGPPFLVQTAANPGADKRTRLTVYGTGIRYSGNPDHDPSITNSDISVQANDAAGNSYAVEFAGAAPGFFGLDQVNLILPAALDGAGVVSLFVTTPDGSSNTVTFLVNSLPASAIQLYSLTLSQSYVTAGGSVTAAVSLNGRAPQGGINVSIRSNNTSAQPPYVVNIPQGQTSAQFTVPTSSVFSTQNVTLTAQAGTVTQTAALEIDPAGAAQLTSFSTGTTSSQGGISITATATLNASAPAGGVTVQLASNNTAVLLPSPAVLVIPFGQQSASITLATTAVAVTQTVTLTATYGHSTLQTTISLAPPFFLTLGSSSVTGGGSVIGTIALGQAAPIVGLTLYLKTTDPVVQLPISVYFPPGQSSTAITITTSTVTTLHNVSIAVTSPSYSGVTQNVSLAVNPPGSSQLTSLTLMPVTVTGGNPVTGVLMLNAPASAFGLTVIVTSSDPHAQPPQTVSILANQSSASFTIPTAPVQATTTVTITATAAGISQTATLKIQ